MTKRSSFRIEAEDLFLKSGFFTATKSAFASGDGFIFAAPGKSASAEGVFKGDSGQYRVVLHYFDENDGDSTVKLKIGDDVDTFVMDEGSVSNRASAANAASRVSFDSVRLEKGDKIQLDVRSDGRELAAIDYIEFIPVAVARPATPPPPPPKAPAPVKPAPEPAPKLDAFEMEVVALTNGIREARGLGALRIDLALSEAAESHSLDMAQNRFFGHVSSDGDRLADRTRDAGYDSRYVGENIAAGHDTPQQVVDSWMRSPMHRANILNPKFNEIGVGFVEDRSSQYDEYWTQVFGYE